MRGGRCTVAAILLALALGGRPAAGRGGEPPGSRPANATPDPLAPRLVPADSPEGRLLAESGAWLLSQMRDDETPAAKGGVRGAWWREFDAHPFTTDALYGGVAGTVLSLMTLAEATGDDRYAAAARRGVRHLLDAAVETPEGLVWDVAWDDREEKVHRTRYPGLYTGGAGIAWVLLTYGDAFGDEEARRAGTRGMDAVIAAGAPPGAARGLAWEGGSLDVISGAAGIVAALLDAWRVTTEEHFREAAVRGAEGLLAAAQRGEDGWSWPAQAGQERVYTGASHGVAGIGAVLARVHLATGDPRFLEAAEAAARWLDRPQVRVCEGDRCAWRHDSLSKPTDRLWEGWCHGPSGTCRLHLLLHSITGEARHREAAEAGARWILAQVDPSKDRSGSGFWSPSLCCGAAGVGTFLLDLHRCTGKAEHLAAASGILGWLDRIADRPKRGEACWSLSGRPEGKDGATWHGTCLMVGQGGYVTFFARLAQERARIVREVFLPPDMAAPGLPPGRREVVVEYGPGTAPFRRVARRLASYRGGERERLSDVARPDALRDLARRMRADALAIVLAPTTLDVNLNRRVLDAVCRLDDDPFPDATYGYLTGADPDHARALLDRMAAVEADGLAPRAVHYGVTPSFDDLVVYPPSPPEDGLSDVGVYLPLVEKLPKVRSVVPRALRQTAGAGVVAFSGNGDAMRVWLFDDRRNLEPARWWPYEPAKVLRDLDHPEMPGIGAADLDGWDLAGKVVWFSTCHSGEPSRTIVIGDVVATFGDTGRVVRFHDLKPGESLCLALLARAPAAYLAPVGANHGWLASVERRRAVRERLPVGEAIRRNQIDIALTYRVAGGIPLVQQTDGAPERHPEVTGAVMREGLLNRVLFGDPAFAPFAALPPAAPLVTVATTPGAGGADVVVSVERADPLEAWDPFHGPDRGERLVGSFPVPSEGALASISLEATPPGGGPTAGEWAIEVRRGRPPLVWFVLNAPAAPDPTPRALWRAGATFRLRAEFAPTGQAGARGGAIVRAK